MPISEAVYVADRNSGLITTFSADPTNFGALTPLVENTGAAGVTDIIPTADAQNLYTFEPGAITLDLIDHNQADATVGQIISTQPFPLSDATTGLSTAVSGAIDPSGQILYVVGTTAAQLPAVSAFSIGIGDSISFINTIPLSNAAVGIAAPNSITVQSNGAEDEILVALQQANGAIALGFNGTTFTGPGTTGVATLDTSTTAVTSFGGVFYASGQQVVQAFTMTFDGAGAELTPDGSAVSATNSATGNSSMSAAFVAGQSVVFVGNINAASGVAAIPLAAGGALTTQFNNLQVLGISGAAVGVNALTSDASGTLFTANTDASAGSLVFPSGLLGIPSETPAVGTGGTFPNAIAVLGI
ncbi:MAG: hypothetical protein ACYCW6_16100 [Candidatus Xenobia bacterium]